MAADTMFYIGFCSCCGTGPLGIRCCQRCGAPVVMCDECEAIWLEPDLRSDPIYPQQPSWPCPHCGEPLRDSPWATRSELQRIGWAPFILGEGAALGRGADPDSAEPSGAAPPSASETCDDLTRPAEPPGESD